jgi:hypothetical protein
LAKGNWRCLCRDNQPEEALKNYVKAAETNKMILLRPFLVKSWKTALALGKKRMH